MSMTDRMEQLEALDKRRKSILHSIEEQGLLNDDQFQELTMVYSLTLYNP